MEGISAVPFDQVKRVESDGSQTSQAKVQTGRAEMAPLHTLHDLFAATLMTCTSHRVQTSVLVSCSRVPAAGSPQPGSVHLCSSDSLYEAGTVAVYT